MSLLLPEDVPADDRGLLLGDGIFETLRLYAGRPFRLDAHIERLLHGARALGLRVPSDLPLRIATAVERWGERDGSLRITLTRGSGPGLPPPEDAESRLLIVISPVPAGLERFQRGMRAAIRGRVDEQALTSGVKALGYMERIQALRLARAAGADEALLTNTRGRLVEGSTSNLLAVLGDTLIAPGEADGALPGITREVLVGAARDSGMEVQERGLEPDELTEVLEVILSSSVREVVPVVEIEGAAVGAGTPGPVFRKLSNRFRAVVESEGR